MTAKLTPHYCDASQLACDIINATFLGLDGFRAMRKEMEDSTYRPLDFAAVMARIVDRELGPIVSAAPDMLRALKAITNDAREILAGREPLGMDMMGAIVNGMAANAIARAEGR